MVWYGQFWNGEAGRGAAWPRQGPAGLGRAGLGEAWLRCGPAGRGRDWWGLTRFGWAGQGMVRMRLGWAEAEAWSGKAGPGPAWLGGVRPGKVRRGCGTVPAGLGLVGLG